jgi:hypothetical protein
MKSSLQEDEDVDAESASTPNGPKRVKNSKDMTPEEKAQRDEKRRKESAEVRPRPLFRSLTQQSTREQPFGRNVSASWLKNSNGS